MINFAPVRISRPHQPASHVEMVFSKKGKNATMATRQAVMAASLSKATPVMATPVVVLSASSHPSAGMESLIVESNVIMGTESVVVIIVFLILVTSV